MKPIGQTTVREYNAIYADMKKDAIADLAKEGFAEENLIFAATADMRYLGQAWELNVPVAMEAASSADFNVFGNDFEEIHSRTYGYKMDDDVVFVNLRFAAFGVVPALTFKAAETLGSELPKAAVKGTRSIFFDGSYRESTVYNRELMPPGCQIEGPAMIEEYAASTPVPPGHVAVIDAYRNIVITQMP
ncbi:hypothetical protein SDC9_189882 [bioreactor metagenome]|uniref:Acetophenone carboxylase-like C-terminal domain-containing protein n=1 Tax=bioreactor metagenome TaxID=1076179 RepID=A0A645HTE0_9ZZZZ